MNLDTLWGRVRKGLRNYYGEAVDRAWFSKLEPLENVSTRNLSLKAPTGFFRSYITQHYFHRQD
ncbi:MAG: DnaA N-terminal domain-containing protein [Janthinobacterium lividum]